MYKQNKCLTFYLGFELTVCLLHLLVGNKAERAIKHCYIRESIQPKSDNSLEI